MKFTKEKGAREMFNNYYLIVEIEYIDYVNLKRDKVRIKHEFEKPQTDLEIPLMMCVKDFYAKTNGCEINSITIIANTLFE